MYLFIHLCIIMYVFVLISICNNWPLPVLLHNRFSKMKSLAQLDTKLATTNLAYIMDIVQHRVLHQSVRHYLVSSPRAWQIYRLYSQLTFSRILFLLLPGHLHMSPGCSGHQSQLRRGANARYVWVVLTDEAHAQQLTRNASWHDTHRLRSASQQGNEIQHSDSHRLHGTWWCRFITREL